jgi:hypothetical protein
MLTDLWGWAWATTFFVARDGGVILAFAYLNGGIWSQHWQVGWRRWEYVRGDWRRREKGEILLTAAAVPPHLTRGHSHFVAARDNKGRRPTRR